MDCGAVSADESAMLSLVGTSKANSNISFSACLREHYMSWKALRANKIHTFGDLLDGYNSCTPVIESHARASFFHTCIDSTVSATDQEEVVRVGGGTKAAIKKWQEKNPTMKGHHRYFWFGFDGSEQALHDMGLWRDMPVHQVGALHAMKCALEAMFAFLNSKSGAAQEVSALATAVWQWQRCSCADAPFAWAYRSCTATSTVS